jgi:hypothetical protein
MITHVALISRAKTGRVAVPVATADMAILTVALDASLTVVPQLNVEKTQRSLGKPVH